MLKNRPKGFTPKLQILAALNGMSEIDEIFKKIETVADFAGHKIGSVSYTNGFGDTPLHVVSNWGDCQAIKLIVAAGADINARGENGFTPLHCATEQDHPEAIALLLSLGALILQDENGDTPQSLASLLGNKEAINALPDNI